MRAGITITADDAAAMDRLEDLEKKVETLGGKVEAVCKYLGIEFDKQDEIRRRPRLDEEFGPEHVEWMFPMHPRTTLRTVDATMESNVADHPATFTTPPLPACSPSEALAPQNPTDNAAAAHPDAMDIVSAAFPPILELEAARKPSAAIAAEHNPPAASAVLPLAPGVNAAAPPPPAHIPEPAVQPAAEPGAAAAAQPDPIAAAASVPPLIPGVNLIEPTPENSQETAPTHSTLIPPGTINAAGMRTRSQSRGNTPAPTSPAVLPLPDPVDPAVAGQSSGSSRGSSRSPRPQKRSLVAEGSTSKRQRQG
jgi:hypothetical protein